MSLLFQGLLFQGSLFQGSLLLFAACVTSRVIFLEVLSKFALFGNERRLRWARRSLTGCCFALLIVAVRYVAAVESCTYKELLVDWAYCERLMLVPPSR